MSDMFEVITEDEFRNSGAVPPVTYSGESRSAAPEVTTHDCIFCGHCETPNECAWSRTCPVCSAPKMDYCKESDGRITGLHGERWIV